MNKLTEVSVKNGYKATYNHYRKLIYPLSLIFLIFLLTSPVQAKYSGGTGEPNDPYLIATASDMNQIGAEPNDRNSYFLLVNDINLGDYTGTQFNIIGPNFATPFTGVFDGNGHTISNFTYDSNNTNYIGIFGYVGTYNAPNTVIKDLTLIDPNVDAGTGNGVGTLVGILWQGTICNCGVEGGSVSGNTTIGGLVGESSDTITDCYSTARASGDHALGGLVGGAVAYSRISNSYSSGSVSGGDTAGGLLGAQLGYAAISNSYSISSVSGANSVGGLIGGNWGCITDCYATGSVSGADSVGGLAGFNSWGDISQCYAAESVTADSNVGGLVGYDYMGSYTKCFWDDELATGVDGIGNATDPNVIGKTTKNMQKESTFTNAGWDFVEIWNIGENQTYPFLRVYPVGDLNHNSRVDFEDFAIFADHWLAGVE